MPEAVEPSVETVEMVETGVVVVIRALTIHRRRRRGLGFWVFF
jgi:hypothetical protein